MGEKSHISALVKSRDAIFSRLFVEQTVLEDRDGVSWSKGQICLMSSEIMFPTEKRQVCLLSIIKDLDSLSLRVLSGDADPLRSQYPPGWFCIILVGLEGGR